VALASTDERLQAAEASRGDTHTAGGETTTSAGHDPTLAADPLSSTDKEMAARATIDSGDTRLSPGPPLSMASAVPPEPFVVPGVAPLDPLQNRSYDTQPGAPPPADPFTTTAQAQAVALAETAPAPVVISARMAAVATAGPRGGVTAPQTAPRRMDPAATSPGSPPAASALGDTVVEARAPVVDVVVLKQPAPRWIIWGWVTVGLLTAVLIAVLVALFRS
jgi:hypothetical protein